MITSLTGRRFIELQEGYAADVYADQLGYPTIGFGHRVRAPSLAAARQQYPRGVTRDEADAMLANDLRVAEAGVNSLVTIALPQGVFDALVDLSFNAGAACLHGSKCLAALNAGDFARARAEFLGFCHGTDARTGQRVELPVLVARRKAAAERLWDPCFAAAS